MDTLPNIENVVGSPFADTILSGSIPSVLDGRDGDDRPRASAGPATLIGGCGNDIIMPLACSTAIQGSIGIQGAPPTISSTSQTSTALASRGPYPAASRGSTPRAALSLDRRLKPARKGRLQPLGGEA